MPEHANRFAGLYDQQNENRIPDWGGDQLFTRMPSRPKVDDAPPPRYRPALTLVETPPAHASADAVAESAHSGAEPRDDDAWRRAAGDPAAEAERAAHADA